MRSEFLEYFVGIAAREAGHPLLLPADKSGEHGYISPKIAVTQGPSPHPAERCSIRYTKLLRIALDQTFDTAFAQRYARCATYAFCRRHISLTKNIITELAESQSEKRGEYSLRQGSYFRAGSQRDRLSLGIILTQSFQNKGPYRYLFRQILPLATGNTFLGCSRHDPRCPIPSQG